MYLEEFSAVYMAFFQFGQIYEKKTKPTNHLTDKKPNTRFSHTKVSPPSLLNAGDYVMPSIFNLAIIAISINTAAGCLFTLKLKVREKIRLKIREGIQTTSLRLTTSSSEAVDEEQFFFTLTYSLVETQEQTLHRKKQLRKNPPDWEINK